MRNRRMHHRPTFGPPFGPESDDEQGAPMRSRRSSRGGRGGPGRRGDDKHPLEGRKGPGRRGRGRGKGQARGQGKRRGRARRGEVRYILLDLLSTGPKHGYEIIKTFEERTAGEYVPSPGSVYPTLQYLEDQGLISATEGDERRTYQLTKDGEAELESQAETIAAFWSRFEPQDSKTAQPEVGFLEDELEHLGRVVWSSLREAIAADNQALIREVRQTIEACQKQVREIVTNNHQA